tara:strand:- start:1643 stop:2455 length:813 start_codon:yes stop_codon:yes gene_type:complete
MWPLLFLFSVKVSDALAHQSELRIVTLSPHLVEWVASLGALDKVVATVERSDYPKQALSIPVVGRHGSISSERILSFRPTLVLAWEGGNRAQLLAALNKAGVRVVSVPSRDLDALSSEIEQVGIAIGRPEQGRVLGQKFNQRVRALRHRYKQAKPVSVLYEMWSQPLMTVAHESMIQQMLELCGARNIFADVALDYFQVSIAQVLERNPQMIIQPQSGADYAAYPWHKFPQLQAVRHQHILSISPDLLHRPTVRFLSGLEHVCGEIDRVR